MKRHTHTSALLNAATLVQYCLWYDEKEVDIEWLEFKFRHH